MTLEEAIEIIKSAQAQIEWEYPMDYAVAFDMAISALEAQDASDTNVWDMISRQDLCEYALNQKDKSVTPNDIMRFPSAQPERDIPKKPNETTDMAWGIPNRQAVCPNCDSYLGTIHFICEGDKRKVTYCDSCGQAIDWSEWEWDAERREE